MSTLATLTPKSEESLKRLAKKIVRDQGIRHAEALDLAARQAGATSYKAFRRALAEPQASEPFSIAKAGTMTPYRHLRHARIRISWVERERDDLLSSGSVEVDVPLQRKLCELISRPTQVSSPRLHAWHTEDGLFEGRSDRPTDAYRKAMATARTLQFMDATGFRVSKWPWNGPWALTLRGRNRLFRGIPGTDHPVLFRDPETKKLLYINEPYRDPAQRASERSDWEEKHLFDVRPLDWGNLYVSSGKIYPELVSLKGHGADLDVVEERLRSYGPILQPEALKVTLTKGKLAREPLYWRSETHPGICAIA